MRYPQFALLLMLALLQFACTQMQTVQKQPRPQPVPKVPAVSVKPLRSPPSVTIHSRTKQQPVKQSAPDHQARPPSQAAAAPPAAILALMTEAEQSRTQGNLDQATATLERALRIQPRNANLWHQLASLRLQQHKPRLAEDLAKKSNTLAYRDHALKQKNWQLIAQARRLQGDMDGAQEAENKAQTF